MAVITVGKRARNLDTAPKFDSITRVVLQVTDDLEYTAGDDTGRTLTLSCPWGSRKMCGEILAQFSGYRYQPLSAGGVLLDPAAELGDSISVGGIQSGICTMKTRFSHSLTADISAPHEEELDHEYTYKSKSDRKYTRRLAQMSAEMSVQADRITAEVTARESLAEEMRSQFTVQAGQISAKVSAKSSHPSEDGTMEWEMAPTKWVVKAGLGNEAPSEVFKITKAGVTVTGTIYATAGVFNGKVYATDGEFKGKVYATDGEFTGKVTATSGEFQGTVYAGNIVLGGENDTMSGGLLTGGTVSGDRLAAHTVSTDYTSYGINTSLGLAEDFGSFSTGDLTLLWMKSASANIGTLRVEDSISVPSLTMRYGDGTYSFYPSTITVNGVEYGILRWR